MFYLQQISYPTSSVRERTQKKPQIQTNANITQITYDYELICINPIFSNQIV